MTSKRIFGLILAAVILIMSASLFIGCSDEPEETYPYYTFPTESEPLKEGAYFITDLGYKEYQHNNKPEDQYGRNRLYIVIINNRLKISTYISVHDLYYEDGIYYGKSIGFLDARSEAIAMVDDLLYIDTGTDILQYKYDPSYLISERQAELELPEFLGIGTSDSGDSRPYLSISFGYDKEVPFYILGELKSVDNDNYKQYDRGYINLPFSIRIYFDRHDLIVGEYMLKIYSVGGPYINWENKEVIFVKDSPSLLFEVDVAEDNSVTVIQIN